ncbi:hypothetical protein IEQ34_008356 [Dendrobium chrysotoxum]|uniref:Neprosin PEP catalytic domain-containing protein n=1 Tax=Dendrobium chrysotoxum TaxID=161865 RepID=A0AAV7GVR8_DENCH|nr:hypothetical protein IEQ34_008356 [Dendrobium chrysotoxum]
MAAQVSTRYWSGLLLLTMCFLSCASGGGGVATATATAVRRRKLETKRHLDKLNKPAVKSIKSPDGDIIDCVNVSHQPSFDHPLFRNHTIQVSLSLSLSLENTLNEAKIQFPFSMQARPSFHPEAQYDESKLASKLSSSSHNKQSSKQISQLWHKNGRCPENTIPIRRTKEEDVLRASSLKSYGKKKHRTIPFPLSSDPDLINENGHEHAISYVEGDDYYGAKATMNVWKPQIQQSNEFSLSQLWILGGSFGDDLNSIEAGWQVSPDLYGDRNTRLFTYWTTGSWILIDILKIKQSDAYQATGCYNLLCSGFIQINNEIAMGASISPISNYGGSQYDISILVWKDPKEGNWWMQFGENHVLGYWPSFLFSYLADSASMIEWGGEIVNTVADGDHTSTQMGSGHFPGEGFGKASYFRNIQIVDSSNNLRSPKGIGTYTEESSCYDVQNDQNGDWGNYFYYGGPGKNPNCP